MTTITWDIQGINVTPSLGNQQDVVVNATWVCTATQDSFTSSNFGICDITVEEGGSFIPFDQLTKDDVLGWVWKHFPKEPIEAELEKQINLQINPPVIEKPLPWVNKTAPWVDPLTIGTPIPEELK